mmetsp:Transcript_59040/g.191191  ORF Transcript_59040/g.191191 Transcript_59040/m.191191 type:complete len:469 (-) Transcript_59040:462-1868(-)
MQQSTLVRSSKRRGRYGTPGAQHGHGAPSRSVQQSALRSPVFPPGLQCSWWLKKQRHHHVQCSSPRSSACRDDDSVHVEVSKKGHQAFAGSVACDVDLGKERYNLVSCNRPCQEVTLGVRHHLGPCSRPVEVGGKAGEAYHHIQRSSPRLLDEDGDDDKRAVSSENGAYRRHHIQCSTQRRSAADGESVIQSSNPRLLDDDCDNDTWAGSIPACPQGHAMQPHTKADVVYDCDRCNRYIAKGEHCETWFTDCRACDFTFCRNCCTQSLSVVAAGGTAAHGQIGERQGHHHVPSSCQRSKTISGENAGTAALGHIGGSKRHQVQRSSQHLSEVGSDAEGTAPQEHNTGTHGHHHIQRNSQRLVEFQTASDETAAHGQSSESEGYHHVQSSIRSPVFLLGLQCSWWLKKQRHHHVQCSSPRSSACRDEGSAHVEVSIKKHQAVDGSAGCDVDMGKERYHHVPCSLRAWEK